MTEKTTLTVADATYLGGALFTPEINRFKRDDPEAEPRFEGWFRFPIEKMGELNDEICELAGVKKTKDLILPFKDGSVPNQKGNVADFLDGFGHFRASTKFDPVRYYGKDRHALLEEHVYPGAVFAVLIKPYTWQNTGRRGVSLNLSGVWMTAKGEKIVIGEDADAAFDQAAGGITFGDLQEDAGFEI